MFFSFFLIFFLSLATVTNWHSEEYNFDKITCYQAKTAIRVLQHMISDFVANTYTKIKSRTNELLYFLWNWILYIWYYCNILHAAKSSYVYSTMCIPAKYGTYRILYWFDLGWTILLLNTGCSCILRDRWEHL